MKLVKVSALMLSLTAANISLADTTECQTVRMAEPGWTDLALTSGIASVLLEEMGYTPKVDILSLSVMLEAMKNNEVDVMLGYWKPAMDKMVKPYLEKGAIEDIKENLTGAKYTYAVPDYVYEAGVRTFSDLAKYPDKFEKRVYGIEPGSNERMIKAIDEGKYGLEGWKVVESSESGMLAQLSRYTKREKWIAFLAWAPHPMNIKYDFHYLDGGDEVFGPNFGGATVDSIVRKGYTEACPNVGQLVKNLAFDVDLENEGMQYIIDEGLSPVDAAKKLIQKYPEHLDAWLAGVKTLEGEDALTKVKATLL
jgi:glycine betaine/proline transport system substrate-binding protein